jgi:hypothetical protein
LNPIEFDIAINAPSFEYEQNRHGLLWFHVQTCSRTLQDQESTSRNGLDVKNFEESLREFFLRIWDSDLKVVANAENS